MARGNRFQDVLDARGVVSLLHFTQGSNIPGILKHGIIPRAQLEDDGHDFSFNDSWRADGRPETTSLSVSFFNWDMFTAVRKRLPDRNWVILKINAAILPGSDSHFISGNAARREHARNNRSRRSIQAFEEMFADTSCPPVYNGPSYRSEFGLPAHMTTDAQAEILIQNVIHPTHITGAMVERYDHAVELGKIFDDTIGEREIDYGLFAPRFTTRHDAWG